ncbi:unnamed protein product [Alternaria alternata]
MFPLLEPYEGFEKASTAAVKSAGYESAPPQTHEELAKLQDEVQQAAARYLRALQTCSASG